MPFVAFVNLAPSKLSNHDADIIVEALRNQLVSEFVKLWPGVEPMAPIFVESEDKLPEDAYPIAFVDLATVDGDLAYHSVDAGGKYYGQVFVDLILSNGTVFNELSRAAGHEFFELLGDPTCCKVVVGPALSQGDRYLFELCDPVQGTYYAKHVERNGEVYEVQVPDVAGPGYFGQPGPLSLTNAPKGPFQMADGGYQIVEDEHGADSNVWGVAGAAVPSPETIVSNATTSRRARLKAAHVATGRKFVRTQEVIDVAAHAAPRSTDIATRR